MRVQFFTLGGELFDTFCDFTTIGAANGEPVDLLAILEEEESGHGGDAVFLGDFGKLVNIDLVELDRGGSFADLLNDGSDGLARTTPGGEEVDDDGFLAVLHKLLPFLVTSHRVSHA